MWFLGCIINIHSNHILRNLRKPGETDYKIPRGKTAIIRLTAPFMNWKCVRVGSVALNLMLKWTKMLVCSMFNMFYIKQSQHFE